MSDKIRKAKEIFHENNDDLIKKDKELNTFFKEGKAAIESFIAKKSKRYRTYFQINMKRLFYEKEIYLLKLEEKAEEFALKKKLRLVDDDGEKILSENDDIISLNEVSDNDINTNEK